jgi:hypothetical protein
MGNPSTANFRTAHQLARDLLALPDFPVITPIPAFDMPGQYTACPVRAEVSKVQDVDIVSIVPDMERIPEAPDQPPTDESQAAPKGS